MPIKLIVGSGEQEFPTVRAALDAAAFWALISSAPPRVLIEEESWSGDANLFVNPYLPSGAWDTLVTVEGRGAETGRCRWTLFTPLRFELPEPMAGASIRLPSGAGVRFEHIDFEVVASPLADGTPARGIGLAPETRLDLVDCTLGPPRAGEGSPGTEAAVGIGVDAQGSGSAQAESLGPAAASTPDDVHVRLLGARLRSWMAGVSMATSPLAPSALVVEDSGFRACDEGVRADGVAEIDVERSRFDRCGTGLVLTTWGGAPRWAVVDCQFTDNALGLRVDDSAGLPPSAQATSADATLRLLGNEFTAPNRRRFPLLPLPQTGDDEAVGLHLGGLAAPPLAPPSTLEVRAQANLAHYLDTGLVAEPSRGLRLDLSHNTFAVNAVRSVLLAGAPSTWQASGSQALLARNLFLGRQGRPWLGVPELTAEGRGDEPLNSRYTFGAVELAASWTANAFATPTPGDALLIVQNLFWAHGPYGDDGSQHTLVFHRRPHFLPGMELERRFSTGDHAHAGTPWANLVHSGTLPSPVLRLPRSKVIDDVSGHLLLRFDAALDRAFAAPAAWVSPGVLWPGYKTPVTSFRGAPWKGAAVGAATPDFRWKQFPIVYWGGQNSWDRVWADAWQPGAFYQPLTLPSPSATDAYRAVLFQSFFNGESTATDPIPSDIPKTFPLRGTYWGQRVFFAIQWEMFLVPPLPYEASANPADVYAEGQSTTAGQGDDETRVRLEWGPNQIEIPVEGPDGLPESYSDAFRQHWLERAQLAVEALQGFLEDVDGHGLGAERIVGWGPFPNEWLSKVGKARVASRQGLLTDLTAQLEDDSNGATIMAIGGGRKPHQLWIEAGLDMVAGQYQDQLLPDFLPSGQEAEEEPEEDDTGEPLYPASGRTNLLPVLLQRRGRDWHGSLFWQTALEAEPELQIPREWTCVAEPTEIDDLPVCQDDYQAFQILGLDDRGRTRPVCSSPLASNYIAPLLAQQWEWPSGTGLLADTNRTMALQRVKYALEANDNVRLLQDTNLDLLPPPSPAFHNPGVLPPRTFGLDSMDQLVASVPENHPRHDFWAGLHVAEALFLWGLTHSAPVKGTTYADPQFRNPQWNGYQRGASILKNHPEAPQNPVILPNSPFSGEDLWTGFREAMANGELIRGTTVHEQEYHRDNPVDWITVRVDGLTVEQGVDYGDFLRRARDEDGTEVMEEGGWRYLGRTLATDSVDPLRPEDPAPGRAWIPSIQWSARRLGNVVWLIVSHGYRPESERERPTLGVFGFGSGLGITRALLLDGSELGPMPQVLPNDPLLALDISPPLPAANRWFQLDRIDGLLIRIELGAALASRSQRLPRKRNTPSTGPGKEADRSPASAKSSTPSLFKSPATVPPEDSK